MSTSGMVLKVTPDKLENTASQLDDCIRSMKSHLDQIQGIVDHSPSFWEGDGQQSYVSRFRADKGAIEEAINFFKSNATNLRIIAGTYVTTEKAASDLANALTADVIV